jgi:ABC-type microcin C transport system duplicated ATPase subunit YejF
VRQIAHRIAILQHGALVDVLTPDALAAGEGQAYTRALLAASPPPPGA